jgi:hypothetical protein
MCIINSVERILQPEEKRRVRIIWKSHANSKRKSANKRSHDLPERLPTFAFKNPSGSHHTVRDSSLVSTRLDD